MRIGAVSFLPDSMGMPSNPKINWALRGDLDILLCQFHAVNLRHLDLRKHQLEKLSRIQEIDGIYAVRDAEAISGPKHRKFFLSKSSPALPIGVLMQESHDLRSSSDDKNEIYIMYLERLRLLLVENGGPLVSCPHI